MIQRSFAWGVSFTSPPTLLHPTPSIRLSNVVTKRSCSRHCEWLRVQINLEQTFFLLCTSNLITARKRRLGQANIFTSVCHSFCLGGVGFPACITGHMTRGSAQHPLPGCRPPPLRPRHMGYYVKQSTSRQYASYWNTSLGILKKNLEDISPFVGSLIFQFWTSGDIWVWHLLTSLRPAWQPSCPLPGIGRARNREAGFTKVVNSKSRTRCFSFWFCLE